MIRFLSIFRSQFKYFTDALVTSCGRLYELDNSLPDDFYWLTIISHGDGTSVEDAIIYCHDMVSSSPKAFLPLPAGRKFNYASVSKERSRKMWGCSYDIIHPKHGYTEFVKIRIHLTTSSLARIMVQNGLIVYICIIWMIPLTTLSCDQNNVDRQLCSYHFFLCDVVV